MPNNYASCIITYQFCVLRIRACMNHAMHAAKVTASATHIFQGVLEAGLPLTF